MVPPGRLLLKSNQTHQSPENQTGIIRHEAPYQDNKWEQGFAEKHGEEYIKAAFSGAAAAGQGDKRRYHGNYGVCRYKQKYGGAAQVKGPVYAIRDNIKRA